MKWLAFWKIVRPCENMPRLHSTSGGFSDTDAKELQVTPYGFPSAAIAVTMVTPVREGAKRIAKVPGIDRRIVAGKFVCRIGRMFGCVRHPPTSERQIFGRQAKRHTSIIGSRRIEIECEVRVHRVGVAELPLQRARCEQTARTARCKQQRDRFGAKVHRKSAVPPQPGLDR